MYPRTQVITVIATILIISFRRRRTSSIVQIPFARRRYKTSEIAIATSPARRKYHLYSPYKVSASEDEKLTVPRPSRTRIIGDKQQSEATKTGIEVILNISFNFIMELYHRGV